MIRWIKLSILVILFATAFTFVTQMNTIMHEDVHVAIAQNHGCINVTKQINFWNNSWVRCEEYTLGRSQETINQKDMLDSVNEIVGYNMITLLFAMFICTLMISITIITRGK